MKNGNRNYCVSDSMSNCVRMEIFTEAEKANDIVKTIARAVRQGLSSDGVIAVLPVKALLRIREFLPRSSMMDGIGSMFFGGGYMCKFWMHSAKLIVRSARRKGAN